MKGLALPSFVVLSISALSSAQAQSSSMKGMDTKDMDMKIAGGTVTKFGPGKGAVTVAHGPVSSMNRPAVTMTFSVKDKAMPRKLSPGQKVEFAFVKQGSDHEISSIK
jgi:Cu(I)/Ag(I) efflux system protein CusF